MSHRNGVGPDPALTGIGALLWKSCSTAKTNNRGFKDFPKNAQAVCAELPAADSPPARKSIVAPISRPLRVAVEPVGGGKWRASLGDQVLCTSPAPLVIAARILIGHGADPTSIIELWHQGADAWALRGQLSPVAAVRLDGERARGRA
jgi:hypothetical protein